jgi:hypothetical protein
MFKRFQKKGTTPVSTKIKEDVPMNQLNFKRDSIDLMASKEEILARRLFQHLKSRNMELNEIAIQEL